MAIQIQLHDAHPFYTNLDYIGGQVILSLSSDEKISNIFVKLEGESRTTLVRPRDYIGAEGGRHRYRATEATENHKVLYKVVHVFPTEEGPGVGTKGQAYTLRAGKHEYPFRFKIPFNNGCSDPRAQGIGPGTGFGGFGVGGLLQMENQHVKRTLPPSLTGFPGVAEIRYYVKVTIQRPSLFKENRRESVEFQFLPIEPPKAAPSVKNVFAKSLYEFKPLSSSTDVGSSKNAASVSNTLPKGEAEARLLGPAVITCNEPIPLQLIIKNLNDSPQQLFLISFELHLIGTTIMKAVDIVHSEKTSWAIITSKSLAIPVGNPLDAIQTETVVDKKLWESMPLPSTVVPSFYTCNIRRRYELEVQLGLGYGTLGNIQAQTVPLSLRFQIQIHSGVSPPSALLDVMAARGAAGSNEEPSPLYDPAYPPQLTTTSVPEIDALPSYEDALADNISPIEGLRRDYFGGTDINESSMGEDAPQYTRHA